MTRSLVEKAKLVTLRGMASGVRLVSRILETSSSDQHDTHVISLAVPSAAPNLDLML